MLKIVLSLTIALITTACTCSSKPVSDTQWVALCISSSDWPKLIDEINRFGKEHHLKVIGGIEENGPLGKAGLNVALAQGYNYYFGDDLDLWITNDPFRHSVLQFSAIGRGGPMSHKQWELARKFLRSITRVAPLAGGTKQEPRCPSSSATQTPR
ncbi:MAG TPA: hypothetical protein VFK19_09495 [Sphingomicrobium sp.]|nr:hypothetical protein [Sphingomicrobium sp.]